MDDRISTLHTKHEHRKYDKGNVMEELVHLKTRYGEVHQTTKGKDVNVKDVKVVEQLRKEIKAIVFSPPTSP